MVTTNERKFKELRLEIEGNRKQYSDRYVPMKYLKDGASNIACKLVLSDYLNKIEAAYECRETGAFNLCGFVSYNGDLNYGTSSFYYFRDLVNLIYENTKKEPEIKATIVDMIDEKWRISVIVQVRIYFPSELEKVIEEVVDTHLTREEEPTRRVVVDKRHLELANKINNKANSLSEIMETITLEDLKDTCVLTSLNNRLQKCEIDEASLNEVNDYLNKVLVALKKATFSE